MQWILKNHLAVNIVCVFFSYGEVVITIAHYTGESSHIIYLTGIRSEHTQN